MRGTPGWAMLALSACATVPDRDGYLLVTNEPFRAAEVAGGQVDYSAVELGEAGRRYRVVTDRAVAGGGRDWQAEAGGSVLDLTIRPGPCEDDMSAARYPFRATITVDGSIARGCARRLSDPVPVPPGE